MTGMNVMMSSLRLIAFFCFLLGTSASFAAAQTPTHSAQIESDEEAFLIRRIAEFWKDGDYGIVKTQILDFFDKYPKSRLKDYFLGILGDIYLQENNYESALNSYEAISSPEITEKIILNKLQCYYELDQYDHLALEGRPFIGKDIESVKGRKHELNFLVAEGCFRQALKEDDVELKAKLASEARSYYDQLDNTPYAEASTFALAEIYAILGEHEKGAETYLGLVKLHPEMQEDLLFQAGILQAHFDRKAAIETFTKIRELDGNKASDASFNLIVLLFQNEDYQQVISSYEKLAPSVPESYQPTFDFIVGKSFFSLGDYTNAVEPLSRYIESQYVPNDQLKNALLIQMTCAHQTANEELFQYNFEKLDTLFPNDPEISKALFMHAMILKEQGAISRADEKLKEIKDKYNNFEDQESFLFEYGLLAHQNERWEDSYKTFNEYISMFPDSQRIEAAWKLFLSSSLNYYKRSGEEGPYGKNLFFSDLEKVLYHHSFLTAEEMKDYSLLYAKTAYELEAYPSALHVLQDHLFTKVTEEGDPLALAEAHFIAGLCHAEMQSDYSAFCMHLEQAMLLNPELYDTPTTHLQLYNAYISLAGYGDGGNAQADAEQQKEFVSYAANHLQEAIDKGELGIKRENRLWLANHYYQSIKEYVDAHWTHQVTDHPEIANAMDLATEHYKTLLYHQGQMVVLTAENLHLENEFLKLAKLFEYRKQNQQKLQLVKNLIEQQSAKPQLNWGSQKQALFELAQVYQDLGDHERAFETFSFIHSSSEHFPTSMSNVATLESARLHFNMLEEAYKTESNEEILSILNDLKELQIRKNVASEPTHLEAALDYAKIRSEIGDNAEADSRYLFFLKRIQDDFNSQEDLVTQDYLVTLNQNTQKKQVFDSYMKYIDAEKYRLQAKQLHRQERLSEMEELHESALSLYSEIKNDPATPEDLYVRITNSIQEINALNAY